MNSIRREWTAAEAINLCDLVFPDAELEGKSIGSLVLIRFKKNYPRGLFGRIQGWLNQSQPLSSLRRAVQL